MLWLPMRTAVTAARAGKKQLPVAHCALLASRDLGTRARAPLTVLGLGQGASKPEIKMQYLALAKKLHPDSENGSTPRFVELQAAYETLMNSSSGGGGGSSSSGASNGSRPNGNTKATPRKARRGRNSRPNERSSRQSSRSTTWSEPTPHSQPPPPGAFTMAEIMCEELLHEPCTVATVHSVWTGIKGLNPRTGLKPRTVHVAPSPLSSQHWSWLSLTSSLALDTHNNFSTDWCWHP